MEHLLKRRLEWFVENRNILANTQFGFRKGLGTMDSLSILTTDIRIAFSENKFVVAAFLDISSAYDSVLLPILRQKMLHLNVPARLCHFICNLLMERSIQVRFRDAFCEPRRIWRGLPQGSVLSPLLFNLYTYDLDKCVDSFCNVLQYADDLALYSSSSSLDNAVDNLNSALSYLKDWLDAHGFSLSVSKSNVSVFTRKRVVPDIEIIFDNQLIPVSNQVKFLGVILDKSLSGKPHLKYVINKCERNINILRCLSGVWWGAHPYVQKLVYNAVIRSLFDYGSFVLEPCSKVALAALDKIQYRCLRIILGAMKSSPTNALQVESVDPPLIFRRLYLADRFLYRAIQNSSHPLIDRLKLLTSIIPGNRYWYHKDFPPSLKASRKYPPSHSNISSALLPFYFL